MRDASPATGSTSSACAAIVRREHDHDLERREELDKERWRILVVTAKGIYQEPDRTVRRVRDALVEQGADRPRLRPTWRKHFPGRPAAS
jgi:hypothetical protein